MKFCSPRSGWWIILLFLVILTDGFQSVKAQSDTTSVDSLKKQIKLLVQDQHYRKAAQAYDFLGRLYHRHYGYNKYTIDSYFSSLKYYSLVGDSLGYYNQYLVIGDYYTQDSFMQAYAKQYLKKAQQYFEQTQNMPKVIECRLGFDNIAQHVEPMPPSLKTHLRETERLCIEYKQPYSRAYALNLLANAYSRAKQPDSAYYFASRSLIISNRLKVNWLIALNHFYLGLVEQFRNHSLAAIEAYQKSYDLSKAENSLGMMRELSRHTADSYSRMGDYKNAYEWSLRMLDFTVQFYASEQTKSIRLQELDSQIKTLAVEKQLVEEQSRNQNVINSVLFVGLIISILSVFALVYLRRQQKLIDHQHTVIAQQQIRDLELKSLRAMIEGQEGERSRIARDLHDGLGIQLSRIKLFIEAHQKELPSSVREPLTQFLDEACTETRLISNDLRPYALSTFGLIPALEDLVQKLNLVNKTNMILDHYGEIPALGDEASVMIYRVVQELLNNALKHAHAQVVMVQLMVNAETTLISVDDNGVGADFDNLLSKGNGIANIKSRIAYLGGHVMWQGEIGKGTSVMISLPMQKLQKAEEVS
ncbi:Histidine kinase-, DNA gyrase B-, and HSP90-like ATPase [Dyadobacter koreensis]|uniref:histidine kinase n=1 Tax=Dyadobacter koreensis TaxID=408657 RepID=A0A1H7B4A0_9BACT|nr:sensor histidine kinase [Dyadobacter koreensis]SEJ72559.1 Histidine kinase-, DNA gyrase B-, and HSP90-like ATPase [Dyadobacter koreensis]